MYHAVRRWFCFLKNVRVPALIPSRATPSAGGPGDSKAMRFGGVSFMVFDF